MLTFILFCLYILVSSKEICIFYIDDKFNIINVTM
jgi:hypothetical protein